MKKKVVAVFLVLVIAVVGFLYFPRGSVVEAINAAVVSILNAGVDASRAGAAFEPALDGDVFATGDVVRADAKGRAVLTFFEGSTLSVDPGSSVKVTSLVKTPSGGIQLDLEQTAGRTWASVSKLVAADSKFEIHTPSITALVRGTAFETIVEKRPDGQIVTTIKTEEGEVVVQAAAGGEVRVPAGTQVDVSQGQPAPAAPQPQPPTPKLRLSAPLGIGFTVIDPRGLRCGSANDATVRQIPLCEVSGGGPEIVTVSEPVVGTYSLVATAATPVTDASLLAEGLGIQATDFAVKVTRTFNVADLVRTSLPLAIGADGKLSSSGFTAPELVSSVCGAESVGRIFSSGKLVQRADLFVAFAKTGKGLPAAIVYTQEELTQTAADSVATAGLPVSISGVAITIDNAGIHLAANVAAGPLSATTRGDVIAGVQDGKLVFKTRQLDAGPLPSVVTDQIGGVIDKGLGQYVAAMPLAADRVAFRSGCFALIGKTD
jgi:FecR-like protein